MVTEQQASSEVASDSEFVISREFAAPRVLVRQAWTEPERLSHWWSLSLCDVNA